MDVNCINLMFSVKVTDKNINMLKRLYGVVDIPNINEEDDIEIGEELDLCYSLEGELIPETLTMSMLFNSDDIISKPLIKLSRIETKSNIKIDKKFNKIVQGLTNEGFGV